MNAAIMGGGGGGLAGLVAANQALKALEGSATQAGSAFSELKSSTFSLTAGSNAMRNALGVASSGLNSLAGIAGGSIATSLMSMGSQLSLFVEALNPSAVMQFQLATKDMLAVVGKALMPVFEALTEAVRETANTLLPLADELAPAFRELSGAFLEAAKPVLSVFAEQGRALIPLLQGLAGVVQGVTPLIQAWGGVMQAAYMTLGGLLKSLIGEVGGAAGDFFKNAMNTLATSAFIAAGVLAKAAQSIGDLMVRFAATAGKLLIPFGGQGLFDLMGRKLGEGGKGMLDNMIDVLKRGGAAPKSDATGLGAATNAQVTDIASYAKAQLAAAYIATGDSGQTREQKEEAFWNNALKELELLRKKDTTTVLKEQAVTATTEIVAAIKGLLPGPADQGLGGTATNALMTALFGPVAGSALNYLRR
jgi:hypothetical protein